MVKLLGILDVIVGLVFLGSYFQVEVPKEMILFFLEFILFRRLFSFASGFQSAIGSVALALNSPCSSGS